MANNNDAIFNAAIAGFYGAIQTGRQTGDNSAGTANAAAAFATELDSKIPTDVGMNAAKANLCQAIVQNALAGTYPQDAVAADYSALTTSLAAAYTAGMAKLA